MDGEKSTFARRHNDCLSCRLISGFGVVGMGAYIYSQAKHRPTGVGRYALYTIAAGAAAVGIARLSGLQLKR